MRKHRHELKYWEARRREAPLESGAAWYEWTFVEHFSKPRDFYAGKRMLDVGCGPRGSLEWAHDAAQRVGVDPLADRYMALRSADHATTYVAAGAERMPFADASFDVVSCLNALDHVDEVGAAIGEMTRVTRPGGTLLLVVDVEHAPTPTEPHRLGWDLLEAFAPDWEVAARRDYERPHDNMLANLQAAVPFVGGGGPGVLSAELRRDGASSSAPATS